jgi:hypothetical protein
VPPSISALGALTSTTLFLWHFFVKSSIFCEGILKHNVDYLASRELVLGAFWASKMNRTLQIAEIMHFNKKGAI